MSSFYTNISENAERVVDPISQQIIYSLVRKLGCQEFFKDNTHFLNDRSANSLYNNPDHTLNFMSQNRLDVTVDTHYRPSDGQLFENTSIGTNTPAMGVGNYNRNNRRIIFSDPKINFYVRELNMPFTVSFNLVMTFREYDGASLALSNILNRSHEGLVNEVHDIVYSYPFDRTTWTILSQVFKYRQTYREKNPNAQLVDYLDSISKAQWGFDIRRPDLTETAISKADTEANVTRQQMSCLAKLDFSGSKPEPIMRENQPIGYQLEFQYSIQFGRPHLLEFSIPPIIEQKPLPNVFFEHSYETDDPKLYGEASDPAMTGMMWDAANADQVRISLFKMPEYDEWYTPNDTNLRNWKMLPLIEAVVTIDELGGYTNISLSDLGDAKIADWVMDILGTMEEEDILSYTGIFNITIFANDSPLDRSYVKWDKNTKTVSFIGNKRETVYRLVFAEATSLKYIDNKWKDTLIKYKQYTPCALMRTMAYLTQVGVLHLIGDKELFNFINKLFMNGSLSNVVNSMISQGCSVDIRRYAMNPKNFMVYICNTSWLGRKYTLYDLFVQTAKNLKYLNNSISFGRLINIDGTYNYNFTVGGLSDGYNVPLRVFKTSITRA